MWYCLNAGLSFVSFCFLFWWQRTELKMMYSTKKCVFFSYFIEALYIGMSIWAWLILSAPDPNQDCSTNAPSTLELLVDMIILLYMRSLRLLSIAIFLALCGPLLLVCWLKNRPRPTEDPTKIKDLFSRVTLSELWKLREKNYKHKMSSQSKNPKTFAEK